MREIKEHDAGRYRGENSLSGLGRRNEWNGHVFHEGNRIRSVLRGGHFPSDPRRGVLFVAPPERHFGAEEAGQDRPRCRRNRQRRD